MTTIVTTTKSATSTAGYIRLTRDESLRKGLSAPAQRDEILAYAGRASLGDVELYDEPDAVGGDIPFEKRKEGRKLLARIKQGGIRNIIVRDMDRLTRDVQLWIDFTALCFKHSVTVHTFNGPLSFEAPTDEFAALVRAAAAQLERKQTGDRVRHTKRQLAKIGKWPGGPAPFGYQLVSGELHPHPREAPIYRRIIDLYIQGWGCRRIALRLNDEGQLQISGSPWHPDRILRVLQNPTHAGFITHDEANFRTRGREKIRRTDQTKYPGRHEALITEERWLRIQSIRQARQITKSVGIARKYALSGILRCACGATMRAASQHNGYAYYSCIRRRNYGVNDYGCDYPRVRIDRADAAYWSSVRQLLLSNDTAKQVHADAQRIQAKRPKDNDPRDELQKVQSRIRIWYDRHDEATDASEQELAWDRIKLLKSRVDELHDEITNRRETHVSPITLEQVRKSLHSLERMSTNKRTQLNDLLVQRYGLSVRLNNDALVIALNISNDDPAESATPIETDVRIPGPPIFEWLQENIGQHHCHHCGKPVKVERRHYWRGIPRYHKSCWGVVKGREKSGKRRPRGYMNGQQVADALGIGRSTVGRWIKVGKLPKPKRIDGVLLWPEGVIAAVGRPVG